jgi:hypothetical protein
LIGLVSRPDLVDRHTLSNILDTRSYTINHIHSGILEKAHHCSARYPRGISEFTTSGLTPHFEPGTAATARLRETYPQSAHTFWDPENEACLPDLLITLLRPTVFQANLRTSQEIKFSQAM